MTFHGSVCFEFLAGNKNINTDIYFCRASAIKSKQTEPRQVICSIYIILINKTNNIHLSTGLQSSILSKR